MSDNYSLPCQCPEENMILVEYSWDSPEHYDGVSEITCVKCKRRWGRWTGKELFDGDVEPRYGEKK